MRDKQSNDTMLGGLSFFDVDYWERQRQQWCDKRLTRRQISAAIKHPEAETEIVSLISSGWEEKRSFEYCFTGSLKKAVGSSREIYSQKN